MLASHRQILVCFEQERMTPEQIADDQGLDVLAVKAILAQNSSSFRKESKVNKDYAFSDSEQEDFKRIIHETALSATLPDGSVDYRTRLKAATYGRDDSKGRLEPRSTVHAPVFNLLQFNEQLSRSRELAERARQELVESTVDV